MQILLKGCTQDVIDDVFEQLGSFCVLKIECTDVLDEPIYQIEFDSSKCILHTFPEWIYIIRTDTPNYRDCVIADFRFEEVIIK